LPDPTAVTPRKRSRRVARSIPVPAIKGGSFPVVPSPDLHQGFCILSPAASPFLKFPPACRTREPPDEEVPIRPGKPLMSRFNSPGLGWHIELPDLRDYSPRHEEVQTLLSRLKRPRGARSARPPRVDWREFCSPVADQGELNACTSHACLGLLQYFERRAHGKVLYPSPLFLYKMTRQLLHWTGDTGATLRATLKAMIRFGIPPGRALALRPRETRSSTRSLPVLICGTASDDQLSPAGLARD
jgi:hypothetical protein